MIKKKRVYGGDDERAEETSQKNTQESNSEARPGPGQDQNPKNHADRANSQDSPAAVPEHGFGNDERCEQPTGGKECSVQGGNY
jgi:hypothetical protein